MANDRLLIRCKKCREVTNLAKYYPSAGLYVQDNYLAGIQAFFDAHSGHHPGNGAMDLGAEPGFEIVTEDQLG